jgi:hypothetical protein
VGRAGGWAVTRVARLKAITTIIDEEFFAGVLRRGLGFAFNSELSTLNFFSK